MDKAKELQVDLAVSVTVDERGGEPVPVFAEITGAIQSETQYQLSTVIESDLGIQRENQLWITGRS